MSYQNSKYSKYNTEQKVPLNYNLIIMEQLMNIGKSSLISEKIIIQEDGTKALIKPPTIETIQVLSALTHPYVKNILKKNDYANLDYNSTDKSYWFKLLQIIMDYLDSENMLIEHKFSEEV